MMMQLWYLWGKNPNFPTLYILPHHQVAPVHALSCGQVLPSEFIPPLFSVSQLFCVVLNRHKNQCLGTGGGTPWSAAI